MAEVLQEYVDSRDERLRVDRAAGVIRGVKLLGLKSRNGRRYQEEALAGAVGLYEDAKVNINHPKGHPLSPRDYQDRLGVVRGVEFRTGEGLFGDLHFNPKHALSEQLVWDAQHAPQNVGMSHNVLARTRRDGDETIVEAITKVRSIDLVADPATTSGLYEHAAGAVTAAGSAADSTGGPPVTTLDSLTLEELRFHRPDLVRELSRPHVAEFESVRQKLDTMIAREAAARRRERIVELLQEHDLPLPNKNGKIESDLVSPQFIEMLMRAADEDSMRRLIDERAALVRSACDWSGRQHAAERPRSRPQLDCSLTSAGHRPGTAAEFAATIRG